MKTKFSFAFSPLLWLIISLALLITLSGTALNIYYLIILSPDKIVITHTISGALCLLLSVLILSIVTHSRYVIYKNQFLLRFGFIKIKYDLKKAVNLVYNIKQNFLFIYFNNGSYARIIINNEKFIAFCERLKQENPNLIFYQANNENKL